MIVSSDFGPGGQCRILALHEANTKAGQQLFVLELMERKAWDTPYFSYRITTTAEELMRAAKMLNPQSESVMKSLTEELLDPVSSLSDEVDAAQ